MDGHRPIFFAAELKDGVLEVPENPEATLETMHDQMGGPS